LVVLRFVFQKMFSFSNYFILLPHNSGTEFKCAACPNTGCMLYLEIQRGKEAMKSLHHNAAMGATAGCTLRLLEGATNGACLDGHGIKGDTWLGSV
jgi:hypothetical protein